MRKIKIIARLTVPEKTLRYSFLLATWCLSCRTRLLENLHFNICFQPSRYTNISKRFFQYKLELFADDGFICRKRKLPRFSTKFAADFHKALQRIPQGWDYEVHRILRKESLSIRKICHPYAQYFCQLWTAC